jgi:glucosylceramidase
MTAFTSATVHESVQSTGRLLAEAAPLALSPATSAACDLLVREGWQRQEILGFGGAFTDAMADALARMPEAAREEILRAYFDPIEGNRYSFCRTHVNSCDFSTENYSYCEKDGDLELETFDISRDERTLIPLVRRAMDIAGRPLRIFASPWSPPAWMKTTRRMNCGGSLERRYYDVWARYLVRYLEEYKKRGIEIWGMTCQNEPLAITGWDNCVYTHAEEREFVKVLGRALARAGLDVKLMVWDHNKDVLRERADVIFADLEASDLVWGVGFHWYGNSDAVSLLDNAALDYVNLCYPGKKLVFTEGCITQWDTPAGTVEALLGQWWTGERYGRHVIEDLNHHTVAWCDWNMVLDERGGPNHVGNYCLAPVIADTRTGKPRFEPPYYFLGHFSRFIEPGSHVVHSECRVPGVRVLAAVTPDGKLVVVALNDTDEPRSGRVRLERAGQVFSLDLPAHSIKTIVLPT